MTTASISLFRSLLIYCICVPLALVLGYLITTPYDFTSYTVVGMVLFFLLVPLMLRWHHAWLIATWNMSVVFFFLPGRPYVWLGLAWVSLVISVVQYILNRKQKFIYVPELIKPLVLIVLVTLVVAKFRGGMGVQSLGSETLGGRRYFLILTSIVGYFAITSRRIPAERVPFYVALYFLSAITMAVGELALVVSPAFYPLFAIFPINSTGMQAIANDPGFKPGFATRLGSLATACSSVYLLMLCRYGIRRLFSLRSLGLLLIFGAALFLSMYGGFRSMLILFLITFAILFYFEGLMRSPLLPAFILITVLGGAAMVPVINRMPMAIQRTLSFLPLQVDPVVRASAQASTEWRLHVWQHVLPEVPEYLWLGKGFSISASDLAMVRMNLSDPTGEEGAELVGDYHNGPLSILIPFGIPGTLAFIWFLVAGLKVLRHNYLYGDPNFRRYNTFFLAYYIAKIIFFVTIFGSFYSDLPAFIGLIALSISINGGVAQPETVPQQQIVFNRFKLQPPPVTKPAGA